jgi:hypothetical protein
MASTLIGLAIAHSLNAKRVYLHLEKFHRRPTLIHTGLTFRDRFKSVRYDFRPFSFGSYVTSDDARRNASVMFPGAAPVLGVCGDEFHDRYAVARSEVEERTILWGETEKSWREISQFELDTLCTRRYLLGVYDCRHYTRDFTSWSCDRATPVWTVDELWEEGAPDPPFGKGQANIRAIIGADVGLSLLVAQFAAHHLVTPSLITADLCIAHATYGRDRLLDQGGSAPSAFRSTTLAALIAACGILSGTGRYELIPPLTLLSLCYKDAKPRLRVSKPLFIGVSWAYAIVYLPWTGYSVSTPGGDEMALFLFYACTYAAASNLADIKDVEQDREAGIVTIPSRYGTDATYALSGAFALAALVAHTGVQAWTSGDWFNEIVTVCILVACALKQMR